MNLRIDDAFATTLASTPVLESLVCLNVKISCSFFDMLRTATPVLCPRLARLDLGHHFLKFRFRNEADEPSDARWAALIAVVEARNAANLAGADLARFVRVDVKCFGAASPELAARLAA